MKSKFLQNIRLAGFPLGLGLTSVLVSGTLNRVMIVELGFPATWVGLFFALPLLISPLRIWLGYRSDAHPVWGLRREPFIILGALLASVGVIGATLAILKGTTFNVLFLIPTIAGFIVYGFGKNLSSNTFEALLADKFTGEERPRAVTFFKVAMFIGIMLGAILLCRLLSPFTTSRLLSIVIVAGIGTFIMTTLAIAGQEPRKRTILSESKSAREVPFFDTFKGMLWSDPQVRRFFIFVMLIVIGTLGQDAFLEPYAALVLGLSVGETSQLTAIWGAGTLLSMGTAGAWLVKRFGYNGVVRVGLVTGVIAFLGLILSGIVGTTGLFIVMVFFLGISTGLSASGMLTAVIDFTTPERAGLLMGVWGLAHNLGQAAGSILSGGLVDLVRGLGGEALTAYGMVFALEAILLVVALGLQGQIRISESKVVSARHQSQS
jgi:MFS transporter, BCD family, chlorophyll transporter